MRGRNCRVCRHGFDTHVIADIPQLLAISGVGFVAGVLGGLAGVGGSMVMLPALHFILGDEPESVHHLYMGAAMTVNILVSVPAALRHHRERAVRTDLLPTVLLATGIAIVAGVLAGNLIPGDRLKLALAVFLLVYCGFNLVRLARRSPEHGPDRECTTRGGLWFAGGLTGLVAGLLGLGGGVILVPVLQMLCRIPLRGAIATSSAVICVTAVVGAGLKLASLPSLGQSVVTALVLAAAMAPTAMVGGVIGAHLTHTIPVRGVRMIVTLLLAVIAAKLAELDVLAASLFR